MEKSKGAVLPLEYYRHHDVLYLSRDLLGKFLVTHTGSVLTGGMIIDTEAYRAPDDRASHAFGNRQTKRNLSMFGAGGVSYVYLCYGIHPLFNVVTNLAGVPHAILIRAILPSVGVEEMMRRRHKTKVDRTLAGGPGTLTAALGITLKHNGLLLTQDNPIWIEDRGVVVKDEEIMTSPRVGVDYAGEDALHPWRFRIRQYSHMTVAK